MLDDLRNSWREEALNNERTRSSLAGRMLLSRSSSITEVHTINGGLCGDCVTIQPQASRRTHEDFMNVSVQLQKHFTRITRKISSMFQPIIMMCVMIIVYVHVISIHASYHVFRSVLPYQRHSSDSVTTRIRGALMNGGVVVLCIMIITLIFVLMFHYEAKIMMKRVLCVLMSLLVAVWIYFFYQLISIYDLSIDVITSVLLMYNFVACGVVCICMLRVSKRFGGSKFYLLVIALSMAWPFIEFDEDSMWSTLVLLAVYDALAVLTPCGPLKYVVDKVDLFRIDDMPGVMYPGQYFMLGLGDFVFYGIVVGRATMWTVGATLSTMIGILFGLALTVIIGDQTPSLRAMPALPLSIFFACIFYFANVLAVEEYAFTLSRIGMAT